MRAIRRDKYGLPDDVIHLSEVEKPIPGENEVLVEVRASSINAADWYALTGKPYIVRLVMGSIRNPGNPALGYDFSGNVVAVGDGVTRFHVGDAVYGDLSDADGGAYADYVAAPEQFIAHKPQNVTFEDAAAAPIAGATALRGLCVNGGIGPGDHVLVTGASGGVGSYAVQIAKAMGAEVTAVCSGPKADTVRTLNPDHLIDYTREDFAAGGPRFDYVLDNALYRPIRHTVKALRPGGTYVVAGGDLRWLFASMASGAWLSRTTDMHISVLSAKPNADDLTTLAQMMADGRVRSLVDRRFSLDETAEAMRYYDSGKVTGKVVIEIGQAEQ